MTNRPFRILSLNGGGLRGVYGAAFLARLEQTSGKRIVDHFDLITGTSTGGLLGLGLALGHSPETVLNFYLTEGPRIFPRRLRWLRKARWLCAPKYSPTPLANALREFLGDSTTLGKAKSRIVIPAFNADSGAPVCFKTRHHANFHRDHLCKAWEIGMATSAAPTYFPPFTASWGPRYVDGGIWANQPTLVGLLEAIRFLDADPQSVRVLSIGTTSSGYRLGPLVSSGRLGWLLLGRVHEMILEASERSSAFQSLLVAPNDQIMSIDDHTGSPIPLDDVGSLDELRGRGEQAEKVHYAEVAARFLETKAPPFEPVP